jgi:hypothetical protein
MFTFLVDGSLSFGGIFFHAYFLSKVIASFGPLHLDVLFSCTCVHSSSDVVDLKAYCTSGLNDFFPHL